MTPAQYREAIARLNLSQVAAGEFLIGNPRTSRRWALGESPVPRAVALLLRLMVRLKLTREDVD
jgi:hypothetical protein